MSKQFPYKTNIDRVITDAEGNPISSGNPLPVSIEDGNADGGTQGTLDEIDARLEKIEKAFDNGVGNMQLTGSYVEETWSDSTDVTKTFSTPMTSFSIINDGDSELTFTINSMTFNVKSKEMFDDRFNDFTQVAITASTPFRALVRGEG